MPISETDIKFKKSLIITDTPSNGGRMSQVEVIDNVRHNLFPRVTKAERENGITRHRKEFLANINASNETAFGVLVFIEYPSTAEDYFVLLKGTPTDTQNDLLTLNPVPMGVGQLGTDISAGATVIQLNMSSDEFEFESGGLLHISNKFLTGQSVDTGVLTGDSVLFNGGSSIWEKIASTTDVDYPNGLYLGSGVVLSIQGTQKEEFLRLKSNETVDEIIGTGDGTTSPTLSNLANISNGVCTQPGKEPVITASYTGGTLTATVQPDGTVTGDVSAGELDLSNGQWITNIVWNFTITNATDITVTYRDQNFTYSGNTATVQLEETVANAYLAANTFASGCIEFGDVVATSSDWDDSNTFTGTYDESTYPLLVNNLGTIDDTWTLTFDSATTFSVSGAIEGIVGNGNTTTDFSPTNPATGQPYFTLDKDGWGGTWSAGETITFKTNPASAPFWLKEVVPTGTNQEPNNLLVLGFYLE